MDSFTFGGMGRAARGGPRPRAPAMAAPRTHRNFAGMRFVMKLMSIRLMLAYVDDL